jgi:hypothetical protein
MADDLEKDLLDPPEGEDEKVKRIKDLSSKAKKAYEERDAEKVERQKLADELAKVKKENEFTVAFAEQSAKYPAAKEFTEEIKQKVLSGYSVDDATISILAKKGKLESVASTEKEEARASLGGSATTTITQPVMKTPDQMTQAERREALLKAEQDGSLTFEGGRLGVRQ